MGEGAPRRIPRLVDAVVSVTSSLDLPSVLREIVEAALSLANARYAALGVIAEDAWLREFIHVGMDDDTVEAIGHLPAGRGVLGELIRHPRPLRLRDLREHPAAHGFPAAHPQMTSFLGAPILVDDEVFGNLYLTDKEGAAEFSAADEELVVALAAVAGAAIHNARLHEAVQQRERWLGAAREVTTALLEHREIDDVLELITWHTRELAGADLALLVLPVDDDVLENRVAVGAHGTALRGVTFTRQGSVSGDVLASGDPVLLEDAAADARTSQPLVEARRFGPAMFIPLRAAGAAFGTLVVTNLRDGRRFTPADRVLVSAHAEQASIAIDLHHARERAERTLVVEERERIGEDLGASVVKRLSAAGWALEEIAMRLVEREPQVSERLTSLVDELDASLHDLRSMIFDAPKRRDEPPA